MRIDVKGRNLTVSEELRNHVAKRFRKIERQVSELAVLELELFEERNRRVADCQVAEATLHLKGVTLRAQNASPDILRSVNLVSDELARQVKRHREKRRRRRQARAAAGASAGAASTTTAGAASTTPAGEPEGPPRVLDGRVVLEGEVVLEAHLIPESEPVSGQEAGAA
ncbi:MAG TPA: ribosome-associated translation inhibitor RaiA [Solirubrobacteraceae bacterium]|nr:ribosome-associated translation inhibitor RaiA [Solirubrobacteraceae bacterium]